MIAPMFLLGSIILFSFGHWGGGLVCAAIVLLFSVGN